MVTKKYEVREEERRRIVEQRGKERERFKIEIVKPVKEESIKKEKTWMEEFRKKRDKEKERAEAERKRLLKKVEKRKKSEETPKDVEEFLKKLMRGSER